MKVFLSVLCAMLLCFAPFNQLQRSVAAYEGPKYWIVSEGTWEIEEVQGDYDIVDIPASVYSVTCGSMDVQKINVDEYSRDFCSVDGVLYTKDMEELVSYPVGREETECTIPEGVVRLRECSMQYWALWAKDSGEEVTVHLPSTLEETGECAFWCSGITTLELPENLVRIYRDAFEWCTQLASVTFPSSLKVIEEGAFYLCALTELHLNEGLLFIDIHAFGGNPLTDVYLPRSLGYIGENAFCDNWAGPITFHVYEGSYAEEWAIENGENYCYIIE